MWKYILLFFFGAFWASLAWYLSIRNSKKIAAHNLAELFGIADTSADHIGTVRDCSTCAHFVRDERGFEVCDNDGSCEWTEKGSDDNGESS